jgi:hypothetical protein
MKGNDMIPGKAMTAVGYIGLAVLVAGPPINDRARLCLEQTRNGLISAAEWSFKPSSGRCSVTEILEYVVVIKEQVNGPEVIQHEERWSPEDALQRVVLNYVRLRECGDTTSAPTAPPAPAAPDSRPK